MYGGLKYFTPPGEGEKFLDGEVNIERSESDVDEEENDIDRAKIIILIRHRTTLESTQGSCLYTCIDPILFVLCARRFFQIPYLKLCIMMHDCCIFSSIFHLAELDRSVPGLYNYVFSMLLN